ncbi:Protein N-terminal asparagine amidohydrolase [Dillenia turbinata]|uniref:Protein N-terminal asparagine amidohydrolase n=1 Tax=Dillenia turbinata TaxID=194707 RepID=A0AAN8VFY8_9MAGN
MIFVGEQPFAAPVASQSPDYDTFVALMEHPFLVNASEILNAIPERKFSFSRDRESGSDRSEDTSWVYVFQREYATVNPEIVKFVGTDEATTCVGLIIRNRESGMTSVAHMDSPDIVDIGLTQMMTWLVDHNAEVELDVHLIGGFEDASPNHMNGSTSPKSRTELNGYSFPLCTKIVKSLLRREEKFHIQTLHVLWHNTRRDFKGNAYPIFNGLLVETSTGIVTPANFDRTSRCPDEIVRRIRVTACCQDPSWDGKLLDTYDTLTDRIVIAACFWTSYEMHKALRLQQLPDSAILLNCSTSPSAEGPDFVENLRRQCEYVIRHPHWRQTFPKRQPRIFERTEDGGWRRC